MTGYWCWLTRTLLVSLALLCGQAIGAESGEQRAEGPAERVFFFCGGWIPICLGRACRIWHVTPGGLETLEGTWLAEGRVRVGQQTYFVDRSNRVVALVESQTRSAGLGESVGQEGEGEWREPGEIRASDDVDAFVLGTPPGQYSQHLCATGFGFSIPVGSTILGRKVRVERSTTHAEKASDYEVRAIKNGLIGSTERAKVGFWPTSDEYAEYGSDSDLWGETWTAADVNAANSGVAIKALCGMEEYQVNVDHIEMTVYYELPSTGGARQEIRGAGVPGMGLWSPAGGLVR